MELKSGDKVVIRKDLVVDELYDCCFFLKEMKKFAGKEVTVKNFYEYDKTFTIKEEELYEFYYSMEMVKNKKEDDENRFLELSGESLKEFFKDNLIPSFETMMNCYGYDYFVEKVIFADKYTILFFKADTMCERGFHIIKSIAKCHDEDENDYLLGYRIAYQKLLVKVKRAELVEAESTLSFYCNIGSIKQKLEEKKALRNRNLSFMNSVKERLNKSNQTFSLK